MSARDDLFQINANHIGEIRFLEANENMNPFHKHSIDTIIKILQNH